MSPTETDFWSQIDAGTTPDDERQPSLPADSPANDEKADRGELGDPQESGPEPTHAREPVAAAAPELRVARPAEVAPEKSKSQRIREFMDAHPEVRNRDIVEALGEYGVTAADVSNVRTQLRKKAEKQQKAKARVSPSANPDAAELHVAAPHSADLHSADGHPAGQRGAGRRGAGRRGAGRRATDRSNAARGGAAAASSAAGPAAGEIAMSEIEGGLSFIEQAGSIERARQVIELIARIREIRLKG